MTVDEQMRRTTQLRQFWAEHYAHVFAVGDEWLDFSNERVQSQAFGVCLEAADSVHGRRCLDVGCGRGQFSRVLAACGGQVTALDAVEIDREPTPGVAWLVGNLLDDDVLDSLPTFERVFMLEILQYIPLKLIERIWPHVEREGRLVGLVPNSECPIAQKTVDRFQGLYLPQSPSSLLDALVELSELDLAAIRGLTFARDQRVVPYRLSAWHSGQLDDFDSPPNRLQFVAIRK